MHLFSTAFEQGATIPSKYTCDGDELSPPLRIEKVPEKAKSLVLLMEDPDVPPFVREDRLWIHWIIFNIPPHVREIAENVQPPGILGAGTGRLGYQGPCPPDREHRYFFKLFAIDDLLALKEGATKGAIEEAMSGHILAQTEYMGRYERIKIR